MSEPLGNTAGTEGPGELREMDVPREENLRDPETVFQERTGLGAGITRRIDPMEFPEGSTVHLGQSPDREWTHALAQKQTIVGNAMRRILYTLAPVFPTPGIHDADGILTTRIVAILKEVYNAGEFYGRRDVVGGGRDRDVREFQEDFERFRHHTDERLDNLFGQYRTILRRLEGLMQERRPPTGAGMVTGGLGPRRVVGGGRDRDVREFGEHMEGFDRAMRDVMGLEEGIGGMDTDPPLGPARPGDPVTLVVPLPEIDLDAPAMTPAPESDTEESPHVVGGI